MKKILWILLIALILCGGFFAYNKFSKKDENYGNKEGNKSTNTKINIDNNKENKTNEAKEKIVQNELIEDDRNTIDEQNNVDEDKINAINEVQENNSSTTKSTENRIKETIAPSGFMGSSLLRVTLYDNGEVYLIRYNGEGYEEKDIENRELLATNASGIKSKGIGEDFEAIIIQGSSNFKVKNQNYSWIEFEQ